MKPQLCFFFYKIKIGKSQIIHVTGHITQKRTVTCYMRDTMYYSLCASSMLRKAWQVNCAPLTPLLSCSAMSSCFQETVLM